MNRTNRARAVSVFASLVFAAGLARADEAAVGKAVRSLVGPDKRVEAIRKAGFLDLYEVRLDGGIFYTDAAGRYAIMGNVVDLAERRNLTQERMAELARINFADLPLDLAAKQVRGKGRRALATFEDPNCPYCRKLAQEIEKLDDVTVYTFLLPILSEDSTNKARAIWCAKDRTRAWHDWIIGGKDPGAATCEAPIDKLQALGRKYRITGTPTIYLADGTRIGGYVAADRLEQALAGAAKR